MKEAIKRKSDKDLPSTDVATKKIFFPKML
jgi:hypothetical protein